MFSFIRSFKIASRLQVSLPIGDAIPILAYFFSKLSPLAKRSKTKITMFASGELIPNFPSWGGSVAITDSGSLDGFTALKSFLWSNTNLLNLSFLWYHIPSPISIPTNKKHNQKAVSNSWDYFVSFGVCLNRIWNIMKYKIESTGFLSKPVDFWLHAIKRLLHWKPLRRNRFSYVCCNAWTRCTLSRATFSTFTPFIVGGSKL